MLEAIRNSRDQIRAELDRIAPPPPEETPPEVCRSLQLILDVRRKKSAEDQEGGRYQIALSAFGAPASWLSIARTSPDARMAEDGEFVTFVFPKEEKKLVAHRVTGLLERMETKDYDGVIRRIVRRAYYPGVEPPAFARPARKDLKPIPFGPLRGFLEAYRGMLRGYLGRVFRRWDRLGDRRADLPDSLLAGERG